MFVPKAEAVIPDSPFRSNIPDSDSIYRPPPSTPVILGVWNPELTVKSVAVPPITSNLPTSFVSTCVLL